MHESVHLNKNEARHKTAKQMDPIRDSTKHVKKRIQTQNHKQMDPTRDNTKHVKKRIQTQNHKQMDPTRDSAKRVKKRKKNRQHAFQKSTTKPNRRPILSCGVSFFKDKKSNQELITLVKVNREHLNLISTYLPWFDSYSSLGITCKYFHSFFNDASNRWISPYVDFTPLEIKDKLCETTARVWGLLDVLNKTSNLKNIQKMNVMRFDSLGCMAAKLTSLKHVVHLSELKSLIHVFSQIKVVDSVECDLPQIQEFFETLEKEEVKIKLEKVKFLKVKFPGTGTGFSFLYNFLRIYEVEHLLMVGDPYGSETSEPFNPDSELELLLLTSIEIRDGNYKWSKTHRSTQFISTFLRAVPNLKKFFVRTLNLRLGYDVMSSLSVSLEEYGTAHDVTITTNAMHGLRILRLYNGLQDSDLNLINEHATNLAQFQFVRSWTSNFVGFPESSRICVETQKATKFKLLYNESHIPNFIFPFVKSLQIQINDTNIGHKPFWNRIFYLCPHIQLLEIVLNEVMMIKKVKMSFEHRTYLLKFQSLQQIRITAMSFHTRKPSQHDSLALHVPFTIKRVTIFTPEEHVDLWSKFPYVLMLFRDGKRMKRRKDTIRNELVFE